MWPLWEEMISALWVARYISFQDERIWLFSKPEGTCFAFASNLCTLKKYHDILLLRQKSNVKKKKITSTNVSIKNLIYKCKQDQLPGCQHGYLSLQTRRLWAKFLMSALHLCVCCLIRIERCVPGKKILHWHPFLFECLNTAGRLEVTVLEFITRKNRK